MQLTIRVNKGKYVLAVSGGIDSMVLLDLLAKQPGVQVIVAHFDHGIRPDSSQDRQFVEAKANEYGLAFEYGEGRLGRQASEAKARQARYTFLRQVCKKYRAQAILTAHHQVDRIETAIINLLRGTGIRGLDSLRSTPNLLRPLLATSRRQIAAYAQQQHLTWREDPTNQDVSYLRNYVRHQLLPRFSAADTARFVDLLDSAGQIRRQLDDLLNEYTDVKLTRTMLVGLPMSSAQELLRHQLSNKAESGQLTAEQLERVALFTRLARPGQYLSVTGKLRVGLKTDGVVQATKT